MTENDMRMEFESCNLEMEAARKATFEGHAPPNPKQTVGRPRKVQPQMILLSASALVIATAGM